MKTPARRAEKGSGNRDRILKAAAVLFRRQGFHGTSTREIAEKAGVSLGNIYNHFPTKEAMFATLLKDYEEEYFSPSQPLHKVFMSTDFPDNIEALGAASGRMVEKFGDYMLLMYVDVVEFDAKHISRLFTGMRDRYTAVLRSRPGPAPRLAEGIDPAAAMMMVVWSFFNYFTMERLFRVKGLYGMEETEVIGMFSEVFRRGLLPR
ncbi:MAG: hypothetical protein A2X36_16050 [Elusimicrobia bacterium GWA2_69_24]|nr:MAG: hypothetical protein A2X36_16050 [Elusimicrobia bacterium GWA2_69_24]